MGTKECKKCKQTYTNSKKFFRIHKCSYNKKTEDPFKPKKIKYFSVSHICVFCENKRSLAFSITYREKKMLIKNNPTEIPGSVHLCLETYKYYESEDEMYFKDYSSITQEEIDSIIN